MKTTVHGQPETILVTGGSGFIGSNFIRYILSETDFPGRIVNLDKLTYAGNPDNLSDIEASFPERYTFEHADICDHAAVSAVFERHNIDSVIHFAAESHVDRSIAGPGAFVQTNLVGTCNLLEAARKRLPDFTLFHHVSTDEVFGSLGPRGAFTETSLYRPNSPYSATKAGSDHLVRAYRHTYGLPAIITNCSNNYGPFQFPEKLVPLIILNALEGRPLPVYGDGMHVRDWLYVRDHAAAIWRVVRQGAPGETYNVGGACEMPNLRVVETICDILDEFAGAPAGNASRRQLITFVPDRPGHDRRYAIDCSKIRRELGWKAEETFETGMRRTVRWYLDHMAWVNRVRNGDYRNWIRENYSRRTALAEGTA